MKTHIVGIVAIRLVFLAELSAAGKAAAYDNGERTVSFEGVSFTYDASIAGDVVATN